MKFGKRPYRLNERSKSPGNRPARDLAISLAKATEALRKGSKATGPIGLAKSPSDLIKGHHGLFPSPTGLVTGHTRLISGPKPVWKP